MFLVSAMITVEMSLRVKRFPITDAPVNYPFFRMHSNISGPGIELVRTMKQLGDEVKLLSFIGQDEEGKRIIDSLKRAGIDETYVYPVLKETPLSILFYDQTGKKQFFHDLKDVADQQYDVKCLEALIEKSEAVILSNMNFNKKLLKAAKKKKKLIAVNVQVIHDVHDGFNHAFMADSDILFLSGENLPYEAEKFILELEEAYHNEIIVISQGADNLMMYVKKENKIYKLSYPEEKKETIVIDKLMGRFVHYYVNGDAPLEALKSAL